MKSHLESVKNIDKFIDHVDQVLNEQEYLRGERAAEVQEVWDAEARDQSEWTAAEREEYNQVLDREYDEYWSAHCVQHGEELRDGRCVVCDAEVADEARNDR